MFNLIWTCWKVYNWDHQWCAHFEVWWQSRCFRSHFAEYVEHYALLKRFNHQSSKRFWFHFLNRDFGHQTQRLSWKVASWCWKLGCCLFANWLSNYSFCATQHSNGFKNLWYIFYVVLISFCSTIILYSKKHNFVIFHTSHGVVIVNCSFLKSRNLYQKTRNLVLMVICDLFS